MAMTKINLILLVKILQTQKYKKKKNNCFLTETIMFFFRNKM